MLTFLVNDDIITAKIESNINTGGVPVPDVYKDVSPEQLRVFNGEVKHLSEFDTYFVDEFGLRHVTQAEGRRPIEGAWDAPLIKDEDGWRLQSEVEQLNQVKTKAKYLVDTKAENLRAVIVTPGDGQMATYLAQEAEAKLLKTNPNTDQPTPYLTALVGILAPTLDAIVDIVIAMSTTWNAANAQINAVRLKTKADIDAADNEDDINELVETAPWPNVQP